MSSKRNCFDRGNPDQAKGEAAGGRRKEGDVIEILERAKFLIWWRRNYKDYGSQLEAAWAVWKYFKGKGNAQ